MLKTRWVTCTTSDLDTCNFKLLKPVITIIFTTPQSLHQRSDWMKLSDLRNNLINALIANLNSYFPEGSMIMFDVFLPTNLPESISEVNNYCTKLNLVIVHF